MTTTNGRAEMRGAFTAEWRANFEASNQGSWTPWREKRHG